MTFGIRAYGRRIRRLFSRGEWMSRLLGLPGHPEDDATPGLVLIQIDGLSHPELRRALEKKEMPFLSRLLRRGHYEIRPMYSGLPSNTPAVQGELLYGVPGIVPAFSFFDPKTGRAHKMLESDSAREIERLLAGKGEGLLRNGSSYTNVYTGGAAEPRWCAASMGWGTSTRSPGPGVLLLLALLNAYGFARALAFAALEFLIALGDALRGIREGEHPGSEFKFIATRMALCILMREWITEGAKMDVARGLPIIHLNFLGYDEQAHRRGPDSAFAHWVLKGIDDAVKRVWSAARKSGRRDYEVWIYSDHGQSHSLPYHRLAGKSLKAKIAELLGRAENGSPRHGSRQTGVESQRVRYLGGRRLQKLFPVPGAKTGTSAELRYPIVTDLGPVALVYLEPGTQEEARLALGEKLAREAGVPLALDARAHPLRGWTSEGPFVLPRDMEKILGTHPFRERLIPDLERLCGHECAGDLILLGWKSGIRQSLTFAVENGAHGGISPEECTAFAAMPGKSAKDLLPTQTPRPADLRHAAMVFQGRLPLTPSPPPTERISPMAPPLHVPMERGSGGEGFRVMTYNVHACVGTDQRHDLDRIARVIAQSHPDVVALQELEQGHARSRHMHQAREIAERLQFVFHFHAVRELDDERFGNAILSRFPMKLVRAGGLPSGTGRRGSETRGALWVEADVDGTPVQILNTHLGLRSRERTLQVRALLGTRWLGGGDPNIPVILCGDLNCGPNSDPYRDLRKTFLDCQLQPPRHKPRNTWLSRIPIRRIDHILVRGSLVARRIEVPSSRLAVLASDHLPLVADIAIGNGGMHVA